LRAAVAAASLAAATAAARLVLREQEAILRSVLAARTMPRRWE